MRMRVRMKECEDGVRGVIISERGRMSGGMSASGSVRMSECKHQ